MMDEVEIGIITRTQKKELKLWRKSHGHHITWISIRVGRDRAHDLGSTPPFFYQKDAAFGKEENEKGMECKSILFSYLVRWVDHGSPSTRDIGFLVPGETFNVPISIAIGTITTPSRPTTNLENIFRFLRRIRNTYPFLSSTQNIPKQDIRPR